MTEETACESSGGKWRSPAFREDSGVLGAKTVTARKELGDKAWWVMTIHGRREDEEEQVGRKMGCIGNVLFSINRHHLATQFEYEHLSEATLRIPFVL